MRYQPSLQIKRQIMRSILDGQYRPHQTLPTIQELSETFKVSTKTVQKAIHALSKEGIIEAKRGVGLFIRSLNPKGRHSSRVGLVHPNSTEYIQGMPYPGRIIEKLKKDLQADGYDLTACPLHKYQRLTLLEGLGKEELCGLVLFEVDSDLLIGEMRELWLPMVSIDYDAYRHGISSVIFDNIHGSFQATQHLLEEGHRHISFMRPMLRNPIHHFQSLDAVEEERIKGYRLAMQNAGLKPQVVEFNNNSSSAREALLGLFGRRPAPSAFVCVADWSARIIASEAKRLGFRIPQDLSLVGFGGSGTTEIEPECNLTSVQVDWDGMGRVAAEMMLAALKGNGTPPTREILPTNLIKRDSVASMNSEAA